MVEDGGEKRKVGKEDRKECYIVNKPPASGLKISYPIG